MKKFYEVVAKCGHVGRDRYYEGHFYVMAESGKDAAQYVKKEPRVKRDHNDAILSVLEIAYDAYREGEKIANESPYMKCKSKHEQKKLWDLIVPNVRPETERHMEYISKYKNNKLAHKKSKNGIRNERKYFRYNIINEYEYRNQLAEAM